MGDIEDSVSGWKKAQPLVLMLLACGVAIALFQLAVWGIREAGLDGRWILAAGVVFGFSILGISMTGAKAMQKAACANPSSALRRYNREVMAAMAFYVVALMFALWGFREWSPTGPLAYALAFAPALPLVALVVIMARYLKSEPDEFQRVLMLKSALIATWVLLAVATVWGFLEMFRLVPHVASWAAFPLWAMGLGIGRAVLAGRYR